ncbi:MAG TPA: serine--tRNA ligase [Leptospiraceae bacterium]|nr:serine--tRNA ligase [Spirochaetaceae bacterium]HBS03882.1 serine--tRNA ligase [Leptospiraceae bacterium]|tara:strand:+ start:52692 stop:53957 length:1266 start_codon:yes stop_codon:yes gene_type:complete
MLELKRIQENPDELEKMLKDRMFERVSVDEIKGLIQKSRDKKIEVDELRNERNRSSKDIGKLIGSGKKEEAEKRKEEVRKIGEQISALEEDLNEIDTALNNQILNLPNWLDPEVPIGPETENRELRKHGEIPSFNFEPRPHYEIGEEMGILDFESGVKLAGSRFYTYRGMGATLERAIVNFMLDRQRENGYEETWVPSTVVDECMVTTGQYPKFKGEYYRMDADELSLIPTAEVPLVNLFRDTILTDLPVAVTAASSCFRREAGAAGKDTRGLVRVHQFQKVELVQICAPEDSLKIHEEMLGHAEGILKALGLPYRVVLLSSGDMGATAMRTYDLEVWMPGLNRWLEISSISNCGEFQARRGMIRFKAEKGNRYVHTLNGSGLAAGRTMIAIMENYQQADGSFLIPEALRPYAGTDHIRSR